MCVVLDEVDWMCLDDPVMCCIDQHIEVYRLVMHSLMTQWGANECGF